jgi:hypothetical protein
MKNMFKKGSLSLIIGMVSYCAFNVGALCSADGQNSSNMKALQLRTSSTRISVPEAFLKKCRQLMVFNCLDGTNEEETVVSPEALSYKQILDYEKLYGKFVGGRNIVLTQYTDKDGSTKDVMIVTGLAPRWTSEEKDQLAQSLNVEIVDIIDVLPIGLDKTAVERLKDDCLQKICNALEKHIPPEARKDFLDGIKKSKGYEQLLTNLERDKIEKDFVDAGCEYFNRVKSVLNVLIAIRTDKENLNNLRYLDAIEKDTASSEKKAVFDFNEVLGFKENHQAYKIDEFKNLVERYRRILRDDIDNIAHPHKKTAKCASKKEVEENEAKANIIRNVYRSGLALMYEKVGKPYEVYNASDNTNAISGFLQNLPIGDPREFIHGIANSTLGQREPGGLSKDSGTFSFKDVDIKHAFSKGSDKEKKDEADYLLGSICHSEALYVMWGLKLIEENKGKLMPYFFTQRDMCEVCNVTLLNFYKNTDSSFPRPFVVLSGYGSQRPGNRPLNASVDHVAKLNGETGEWQVFEVDPLGIDVKEVDSQLIPSDVIRVRLPEMSSRGIQKEKSREEAISPSLKKDLLKELEIDMQRIRPLY